MNLYSALDDKYLVLKVLRHGSHSLTCKQHHASVSSDLKALYKSIIIIIIIIMPAFSLRSRSPDGAATDCGDNIKLQLTTDLSTPKGLKAELA